MNAPHRIALAHNTLPAGIDHRILAFSLVISALIHSGIGWSIYDHAVSRINSDHSDRSYLFRVKRAANDFIFRNESTPDTTPVPPDHKRKELARSLLNVDSHVTAPTNMPPNISIRQIENHPSNHDINHPQDDFSSHSVPPAVIQNLIGNLTLELPIPRKISRSLLPSPDSPGPNLVQSNQVRQLLSNPTTTILPPPKPVEFLKPVLQENVIFDHKIRAGAISKPPTTVSQITFAAIAELELPQYLDEYFDYRLYRFLPRPGWRSLREGTGYFRVDITGRRSLTQLATMPKDIVYVIDTSGSVTQAWVDAALTGIKDALGSLNKSDRFNIVLFKESPVFFHPDRIQLATHKTVAEAEQFLTKTKSGGYTDINRALNRLLVRDTEKERVYELILISDGQSTRGVMDARELINQITRDNDLSASIYCVGIGNRQDRKLLEFLAYRNRGFCVFSKSIHETPGVIRTLTSRLRYPLIKDVVVNVGGLASSNIFPREIPHIHQGQTVSVFGRFDKLEAFTMQVSGSSSNQPVAFTFKRDLAKALEGDQQIAHDWAFWKLHHLYSELIRQGNNDNIRRQIEWLAKKYEFKTVY
ncbi:MAG: hypothetical protein CMJ20_06260 [Phycisphaeraceae bacterium]|nr:hypothetical protein [Phycisphaeraceae bacterium]